MHINVFLLTPVIGWILIVAVCGSAVLRGGIEERIAASAMVGGLVLTQLLRDRSWSGTQWTTFWIDLAFLGVLVGLALRSRRFWPIFASGFQLLSLVTHVARTLDPGVRTFAYASAEILWTWLVLISMAFGVRASWREQQQQSPAAGAVPRP